MRIRKMGMYQWIHTITPCRCWKKASQVLLSRRVGVVVAVADAEDAPAADAPDVDVPAADAPAADAPCQAACQPLVTQDKKCWAATATWMTSLRRELVGPSSITARRSGGQAKLATQKVVMPKQSAPKFPNPRPEAGATSPPLDLTGPMRTKDPQRVAPADAP